jgi:pimeloyl-ACP methyl ester carboxylesterase
MSSYSEASRPGRPGSFREQTRQVLAAHRAAGRPFTADGARSFVREEGDGPTVVFIHGMWGASFASRKLLADLADRGIRAIAWDLPGFGFADRPRDFDYSWAGLARFSVDAVDALRLDRFHLVVHDVGGPIGFELAAARPGQVLSLTILNTMVDVSEFRPPWSMRPFRLPVIGELWKAGMNRTLFRSLMRLQGIGDTTQVSDAELDAYLLLMRGDDNGRAFLRVMRSADQSLAKQALYRGVVGDRSRPVQVIWAADDPALALASYGEKARRAAHLDSLVQIPGKHFPQEDHAALIASHIAGLVSTVSSVGAATDELPGSLTVDG